MPGIRRFAVVLLVLAAVVVSAFPAQAGAIDPNDTPGPLDISGGTFSRSVSGGITYLDLHTYGNWTPALLAHHTRNRIFVLFDVDNDGAQDFRGTVQSFGGRLSISIHGLGQSFDPIRARHPAGNWLQVILSGDSPPNPLSSWQVAFRSQRISATGACTSPCRDRAPDMGWWTVPAA